MGKTETEKEKDPISPGKDEAGPDLYFSLLETHILTRITQGNDFPATSAAVSSITSMASTEDTSMAELTSIILKDYGLTSKLLQIVNTVNFARFGEVTTVSRALILLGMENIKSLAISMSLFEVVGKKPGLSGLLAKAIYAGIIGRKIARRLRRIDAEEAFICSLFQFFGEILTAYYVPDKYAHLRAMCDGEPGKDATDDQEACRDLYERIGVAIGTGWGFPDKMVRCMKKLLDWEAAGRGEMEFLHCISNISGRLAETARTGSSREEVETVLAIFGNRFGKASDMLDIIDASNEEFPDYCAAYGVRDDRPPDTKEAPVDGVDHGRQPAPSPREETGKSDVTDMLERMSLDLSLKDEGGKIAPEVIFAQGLKDIANTMIDGRGGSVNDVMRVILETMYRGLAHAAVSRVAFFIKSTRGNALEVRSVIGDSLVQAKMWVNITLGGEWSDIFNLAMRERKDLAVANIRDYGTEKILPACFLGRIEGEAYLIVLPIVINDVAIGVFYLEGPAKDFANITASQFHQLKILVDQAVLAIRRNSKSAPPQDQETKYRTILGIGKDAGKEAIKSKYRDLISKYHPDKVQHLAKEFHEIAEEKTKQILEAYRYFQKKLNF